MVSSKAGARKVSRETFCAQGNRLRRKRPGLVTFCAKRHPVHKMFRPAQNVPAHRPDVVAVDVPSSWGTYLRLGSLPVNADGRTLAVGNVLQNDAANKSTARTYLSHGERTLDDL